MAALRNGKRAKGLDGMLNESSRRILHAMTFAAEDKSHGTAWGQAAEAEEQVACLLELAGRELDAVIHRFSAASCFAKAEKYVEAITLARSALSFTIEEAHRHEIEGYLKKWRVKAKKQFRDESRRKPAAVY